MKFIIVNVTYKGILKLVLLFQTLQLIAQRPIASIYEKKPKLFTNKSPWGIKTHGKHVLWLFCRMHTSWPKRTSPVQKTLEEGKELRVDNQPLFITNQKEQLKTYTREPSPCEWTKGCSISFLPPSTWREQYPRVVMSTEVWRMMELHHFSQDYTSSKKGAKNQITQTSTN